MNADLKEAAGQLRHSLAAVVCPRRASSSRQRRSAAWASRPGALAGYISGTKRRSPWESEALRARDAVTLQAKFERDEFERIIEAYGHPYA